MEVENRQERHSANNEVQSPQIAPTVPDLNYGPFRIRALAAANYL